MTLLCPTPMGMRMLRSALLRLSLFTPLACAGVTASPTNTTSAPSASMSSSTFAAVPVPATDTVPSAPPPRADPTLTFAWAAVNLALTPPYDTIQLQAIARTASGDVIHDTNTVHYTTPDTMVIRVSATGLVTALPTREIIIPLAHVIASVTEGGRILADTAVIKVTHRPLLAPLATFSIQPQPGGLTSAHANLHNTQFTMPVYATMPFFATTKTGNPAVSRICTGAFSCDDYPIVVHFASSDPSIAYIDESLTFMPLRVGRVTFTASTVAYGVHKTDSLRMSIGYDQQASIELSTDSSHQPSVLTIAQGRANRQPPTRYSVGLRVWLSNGSNQPVEVSLPRPAHGIHFVYANDSTVTAMRDTLRPSKDGVIGVKFDSAGTYTLQYHGLKTGEALRDTFTVVPYP